MIKHGYNQQVKKYFEAKFLLRQAQQTGSADMKN
jgi:hypothetical protein